MVRIARVGERAQSHAGDQAGERRAAPGRQRGGEQDGAEHDGEQPPSPISSLGSPREVRACTKNTASARIANRKPGLSGSCQSVPPKSIPDVAGCEGAGEEGRQKWADADGAGEAGSRPMSNTRLMAGRSRGWVRSERTIDHEATHGLREAPGEAANQGMSPRETPCAPPRATWSATRASSPRARA